MIDDYNERDVTKVTQKGQEITSILKQILGKKNTKNERSSCRCRAEKKNTEATSSIMKNIVNRYIFVGCTYTWDLVVKESNG
jgi:hypothetical protein